MAVIWWLMPDQKEKNWFALKTAGFDTSFDEPDSVVIRKELEPRKNHSKEHTVFFPVKNN